MIRLLSCSLLIFAHAAMAEGLGQEIWLDFASPVMTPAHTPLAAGAAATALLYGFKYEVGDPLQRSWAEHKPLGPGAKYGDAAGQMLPNAVYALGMAISGWGYDDEKSKLRSILMIKATVYSGLSAQVLKYAFQEPRPNHSRDMASFPSGHAASAFSFAAVVGAEHEWYYSVPAYALATYVAASRINDNKHRLHDVVGGATLGLSYGLGLYYRQHANDSGALHTVFQVLPTNRLDGMMLTAFHEF